MKKDYRDTLKKILAEHPEIGAIHIEYKQVERLTLGEAQTLVVTPVAVPSGGPVPTPSLIQSPADVARLMGKKPIVNEVSPELIAKLRGEATVEDIPILNAPSKEK